MRKSLVSMLSVLMVLLLTSNVWAQDDPSDVDSNQEKILQLSKQMKQIGQLIDSLSNEVEEEVEIEMDQEKENINIDIGRKAKEKLTSAYSLVNLGATFIIDNEASDAKTPDFSPFRSWSGQLGFTFITRFGQQSRAGLEYGLVYQFTELDNRESYQIMEVAEDRWEYIKSDQELDQSELYAHYLTLPVAIRFNDRNNDKFSVSVGGFAGLRLGGTQELKYERDDRKVKDRVRTNFGFPQFNYGLTLGIGGSNVQWYSTYQLNNFFDSDEVYDWNAVSTGIRFTF